MKRTIHFECIKGKVYYNKKEVGTYNKEGVVKMHSPITKRDYLSWLERIFCRDIRISFMYHK